MATRFETLWRKLFGEGRPPARLEKVLAYIVRRVGEGVPLEKIVEEEYVRRNASQTEVDRIRAHPEVVEAARLGMHEDFRSGELDPEGTVRRDPARNPTQP